MTINNVRIFLHEQDGSRIKATATMLVNNQILLQGIRVFAGKEDASKLRVSYPVQQIGNGALRHCMYPSNAESRARYDALILDAYRKVVFGEAFDNTIVYSENEDRPSYEITRAGVFPIEHADSLRARVNVELDGELWLRGIRVVIRSNGALFLNMPKRQLTEAGEYMAYFHPIDQEARNVLTGFVIPFYEEVV